jgi:8-oxo-dGTP pyrophosphatase MutT (NUDIX family)
MMPTIVPDFDWSQTAFPDFPLKTAASLVVLGADGRLIMQKRDEYAPTAPNMIALFGGGHEPGETLAATAVREIMEELEIAIDPAELVTLGATTRLYRRMTVPGLVAKFFWHDQYDRVRHTTEGALIHFNSADEVLARDDVTFGTRWAIEEAVRRGLIR